MYELSNIDRKILAELQLNARISFTELGKNVGLTTTPCIERVRKLEREGYIQNYCTQLNGEQLDAGLVVFVQISLDRSTKQSFEQFKRGVTKLEQVQECYLVTGSFDFLIKARVKDMNAYRYFLEDTLLSVPGVQDSTSIAVMESLKETLAIPISVR